MLPIWQNRPLMVTIIVIIVLFAVLIITAGDNNMSGTESIVGSLLAPVQNALYSATDATADFFSRMFSGADLRTENIALEARVAELESQLQDYEETKMENERLGKLLNFSTQTDELDFVTARVIGKPLGHWFNVIILNVGVADGVEVDMPVVNGDGLVGRVVAVGAGFCRVITIVDSSSGVAAFVERTRDNGMLSGTISTGDETDALLTMGYLPLDADLIPGDTVMTSGLSGVFPKGIVIGDIVEVSQSSDGMKNEAAIMPRVDFDHLEEVMVITSPLADVEEMLE
jgi:rod shape-determining protein MreC